MDCSLTGSSDHGIFQGRILEWVAISFSRDRLDPGVELGSSTLQADSLPIEPPGKQCVQQIISNFSIPCSKGWSVTSFLTIKTATLL